MIESVMLGLFGAVAVGYAVLRVAVFWAKHELMKEQLESAISNVRIGYTVTRRFTKIIADAEMTGKAQTFTVTKEFAEAMYNVERHLKETLEMLEPTDSLT